MYPHLNEAVAGEHRRELLAQADHARLVRAARRSGGRRASRTAAPFTRLTRKLASALGVQRDRRSQRVPNAARP